VAIKKDVLVHLISSSPCHLMSKPTTMSGIETPFKVSVPDAKIELLRKKLDLVTFPDELQDAEWRYGVPLSDMKRLVARWKNGYNWRAEEKKLNDELPQFTRDIEIEGFGNLNIHYVHKRSTLETAIPLLFLHGCKCCTKFSLSY
jgi:hypothetical protein